MEIRLTPMDEAWFVKYRDYFIATYSQDLMVNEGYSEGTEKEIALNAWQEDLPMGVSSRDQYLFVLFQQQEHIGFLWYSTNLSLNSVFLEDLSLLEKYRGKGLGRIVLGQVIQQAEDLGYQRLALSVGKKNQAAISLYEKMGFEISHLNMFRQLTPPEHTSSSKS